MKTSNMPVIDLKGTARQRGRIYGESAKTLIAEVIEHWRADLGGFFSSSNNRNYDSTHYLEKFLASTNYLSAIQRWAPDLLEEVEGIAEGSGQKLNHILGLQLVDEEWAYGLRKSLNKPTSKCTAFAVTGQQEGISYAGQNMDVPSWVEGRQVLLRIAATESLPETLVFSKAGNIGLNGLNANGLGVTCNTLVQLNYAACGLPVAFIVRALLTKKSIDEGEHFLRTINHASGQNYILSSRGDMRCFECCATSVVSYEPKESKGKIAHTNHSLASSDYNDFLAPDKRCSLNSLARLDSITRRLSGSDQNINLESMKAALSAHDDSENPVSRNVNKLGSAIGYTAGSSIYEFGEKPILYLASGPPCETEYLAFEFSNK